MPNPGEVYAFDRYKLNAGPLAGVTATVQSNGTDDPTADPQYLERASQSAQFVQSGVEPSAVSVLFATQDYATQKAVYQMLDYPHQEERALQVYKGDPASPVLCEADVTIRQISRLPNAAITALFDRADPVWSAIDGVELSTYAGTVSFSATGAILIFNKGMVRSRPTYKFGWSGQRVAFDSAIGWRYRRDITITNSGTQDWHDEPLVVDLDDTAAWVTASKAQADGDDIRIMLEGDSLARTLVNPNTKRTFVWFLATIPAGESVTYQVWYGNPNATAPDTLSNRAGTGQTYAAFDLEGVNGTATGGTSNTLTASIGTVEQDRWNQAYLQITGGTGSGQRRRILDTAYAAGVTTFTVNRNFSTTPDATSTFVVWASGVFADGGRVTAKTASSITDTAHTNPWGTNSLEGATVTFIGGSGATPSSMTVLNNTGDALNFTGSFSVQPAVNDSYIIERMGVWSYVVDTALTETAHRGLYRENRQYTQPTRIWPNGDTPGGWQLATYLANDDDYAQFRPYDTGSGGGHASNFWPLLRGRRRVGQDRTYKNEGNGDGLAIHSPFKFQAAYWDWQIKNINGVGRVVFAVIETSGGNWADVVTYSTTQAALTNIAAQWADLSAYNDPSRLYMGVLPNDSTTDAIPTTASPDDEVEVRNNDVLNLFLVIDAFGGLTASRYLIGAESSIYDLNVRMRIGGGNETDKTPPYNVFQAGGSGHKIGLKSTEELWLTTDPSTGRQILEVHSTTDDSLVYLAPWAGRIYRYRKDVNGVATAVRELEFVPLPAALNLIINGDFASNDVSRWTMTPSAGVTATKNYVSSPSYDATGAMEIDITATPAGAWTIDLVYAQIAVTPAMAYAFGFCRRATANGASLAANLAVLWQGGVSGDATQTIGGSFAAINTYYRAADENYTYYVPTGLIGLGPNVKTADITITISGTGAYVGKVYLDMIAFGVPAAWISETNIGTLTFDVVWTEGYL